MCKNTTTVFPAGRKRRPKGNEREVWEATPLYSLLRRQGTEGGVESSVFLNPNCLVLATPL